MAAILEFPIPCSPLAARSLTWWRHRAESTSNHGRFVRCVALLTNDLKKAGTITRQQKGAIQSCAADGGGRTRLSVATIRAVAIMITMIDDRQ